jgi:SAM-dependent methyltransferase
MTKLHSITTAVAGIALTALLAPTSFAQAPAGGPAGAPAAQGAGPAGQGPGQGQPGQGARAGGAGNNLIPYPLVPYQMQGYSMELPYQIAAEVLAQDYPSPKMIVDVGSYQGQFLQPFMQRFPAARGQWTEPVTSNEANAKRKLARFGERVDYVIGCPGRDISQGCVPKGTDVIITAWVTHHQPIAEIAKIYAEAHKQLPANGWFIVLDNITASDANWERRFKNARWNFNPDAEGPPMEAAVRGMAFPTLDQQMAAFKSAGFDDVSMVWRSFDTVLIMAHKK